jgi:RNA polymerase sigma factor (TIGR02999 family)
VSEPSDISRLLNDWRNGDKSSLDTLLPLVYDHLKRVAHRRLLEERPDHTLNTTGLVHEAYLRLAELNQIQWQDRGHFYAFASRIMRRVLIDYANRRKALKRTGSGTPVEFDEAVHAMPEPYAEALTELDEALHELEDVSKRQVRIIEFRYFGGLTVNETADVMGLGARTIAREMRFARAWLAQKFGPRDRPPSPGRSSQAGNLDLDPILF